MATLLRRLSAGDTHQRRSVGGRRGGGTPRRDRRARHQVATAVVGDGGRRDGRRGPAGSMDAWHPRGPAALLPPLPPPRQRGALCLCCSQPNEAGTTPQNRLCSRQPCFPPCAHPGSPPTLIAAVCPATGGDSWPPPAASCTAMAARACCVPRAGSGGRCRGVQWGEGDGGSHALADSLPSHEETGDREPHQRGPPARRPTPTPCCQGPGRGAADRELLRSSQNRHAMGGAGGLAHTPHSPPSGRCRQSSDEKGGGGGFLGGERWGGAHLHGRGQLMHGALPTCGRETAVSGPPPTDDDWTPRPQSDAGQSDGSIGVARIGLKGELGQLSQRQLDRDFHSKSCTST